MFTFAIEAQNKKTGEWYRHNTLVCAESPNDALKQYVVTGPRPYAGIKKNGKGKRFRAVEVDA